LEPGNHNIPDSRFARGAHCLSSGNPKSGSNRPAAPCEVTADIEGGIEAAFLLFLKNMAGCQLIDAPLRGEIGGGTLREWIRP
jgi:hypothetical protein